MPWPPPTTLLTARPPGTGPGGAGGVQRRPTLAPPPGGAPEVPARPGAAGGTPPRKMASGRVGKPPLFRTGSTVCFGCATNTVPKLNGLGESAMAGAATPLPVTVAIAVTPPAAADSTADLICTMVGANVTLKAHACPCISTSHVDPETTNAGSA